MPAYYYICVLILPYTVCMHVSAKVRVARRRLIFFSQAAIRRKLREIAQKMERWRAEEEKKKAEAENEEKEEQERRQKALEEEQRIAKVLS